MKVFKFGGASIKSAEAVRNVVNILNNYSQHKIMLVVSAMAKTTNALEKLIDAKIHTPSNVDNLIIDIENFHNTIIDDLFPDKSNKVFIEINDIYKQLKASINQNNIGSAKAHAEIVSFGEIISTTIIHNFLLSNNIRSKYEYAGDYIITENKHLDAKVNWDKCPKIIETKLLPLFSNFDIIISQGFIAKTKNGDISTLGREGSDYSASIFAYGINATDITIWKDVPGLLNADPKYFKDAIKLDNISYRETIELAYYGASVIHPKTIQPLKKKRIPLYIKSFLNPDTEGTLVQQNAFSDKQIASYILKKDQVLLSISARDFSFIAEDSLSFIFKKISEYNLKVNLMQNSAISFSICLDNSGESLMGLIKDLQNSFRVKYNENMELITIQNYKQDIINTLIGKREIFLEQKSRTTVQILVR